MKTNCSPTYCHENFISTLLVFVSRWKPVFSDPLVKVSEGQHSEGSRRGIFPELVHITAVSLDLFQLPLSGSYRKETLEASTGAQNMVLKDTCFPRITTPWDVFIIRVSSPCCWPQSTLFSLGAFSLLLTIPIAVSFFQPLMFFLK